MQIRAILSSFKTCTFQTFNQGSISWFGGGYAMVHFAAVGVPEHSKYKSELTAVMQLKK